MGSIESIFTNIRHAKRLDRINYRTRKKVDVMWKLYCIMHNICKITPYRPNYGI